MNAPCHGRWEDVYPIPDGAHGRRMTLRKRYGGPNQDPENLPDAPQSHGAPVKPAPLPKAEPVTADGWPLAPAEAQRRQTGFGPHQMSVGLGEGVAMKLVRIPPGEFVMGSGDGEPDEQPLTRVLIRESFWMGACEVTNEQFRCFDPDHDCRYYAKRHARSDDQGLWLNRPRQPVVRVSWRQAMAFCEWLTTQTGMRFTLPTEAQWEYACRAGAASPAFYGDLNTDFSAWGNLADRSFGTGLMSGGKQVTGGLEHLVLEGALLADNRFNDGAVVTAEVGGYQPNAWGLRDMHGNAAEWTLTTYRPYPYQQDDGREDPASHGPKVVRGGSFFDRPARSRSAVRLSYPSWRRVFNVGFRVVSHP